MSMLRQMIGQHIFIGISGLTLTDDEKKFIIENNIGGVTLFGRNVSSPEQIHHLCNEIQNLRFQTKEKLPLFIAIDMEGGRVARLKAPFTQWPPLKKLGDLDSPSASFQFAFNMGQELRAVGINLDFAPVVDIFTNPKNTVIGDRAISTDPEMVAKHASALVRGYMKAAVLPCVKHFPGHGDTIIDSHDDLPVEQADLKRLDEVELVPFKRSFKARCDLLMTGHIRFPNIDPEWPVTLSEIFLKKILREQLRYKGMVITDDLDMKALSSYYAHDLLPVRSLQAGCDILLYCNEPTSPPKAMEALQKAVVDKKLKDSDIQAGYKRLLDLKKQYLKNPDPPDYKTASQIVGHADHFKLSEAIEKGEAPPGLITSS